MTLWFRPEKYALSTRRAVRAESKNLMVIKENVVSIEFDVGFYFESMWLAHA